MVSKGEYTATYQGKPVKIITVFSDTDLAMVEDEDGNIFDIKHSLLSITSSS